MLTKKNLVRLSVLAASLLAALWAINFAPGSSAHEGHKHAHAPASAKKLKNPLTANNETIAGGRTLFNKNCARCHGEDGQAKTEAATAMKKKPTDLTAKAMHGITDGEIWWVITNGIKASGMPAYKTKASEQERWQMTLYVKHLMGETSVSGHSDHHAGVNQRGDQVMGFSHEKTTHHFRLKTDGGFIEVEANEATDTASITQIRTHLQHIAHKFAAGDFDAPMLIHGKIPPGVETMKKLQAAINYQFEETEKGGRVRIVTSNVKALKSVHEFLRFQIADHKTGDTGKVE